MSALNDLDPELEIDDLSEVWNCLPRAIFCNHLLCALVSNMYNTRYLVYASQDSRGEL